LAAAAFSGAGGSGGFVHTGSACNFEAATAIQVYEAVHYFTTGENPPRMGQAHRGMAPYQVFPSADGYVTIGAGQPGSRPAGQQAGHRPAPGRARVGKALADHRRWVS